MSSGHHKTRLTLDIPALLKSLPSLKPTSLDAWCNVSFNAQWCFPASSTDVPTLLSDHDFGLQDIFQVCFTDHKVAITSKCSVRFLWRSHSRESFSDCPFSSNQRRKDLKYWVCASGRTLHVYQECFPRLTSDWWVWDNTIGQRQQQQRGNAQQHWCEGVCLGFCLFVSVETTSQVSLRMFTALHIWESSVPHWLASLKDPVVFEQFTRVTPRSTTECQAITNSSLISGSQWGAY